MLNYYELNEAARPSLLAWLQEHGVRETCPACESPDYALSAYGLVKVSAAAHIPSSDLPYARICRRCGHVMLFQLDENGLKGQEAGAPAQ